MKVTAERIDNHKVVLEMEVPADEVNKAYNKAYQKLANKVNIPGFRKGKVPRNILEMRLGKDALKEEVFDILASEAYTKALDEENITPVSRPEIDIVNLAEGQPLVFKATVIAKPEVTLGEYKGLVIPEPKHEVTDEDVEKDLEALRQRNAQMIVVEDAEIQKGDFAIIDFEGFVDGKPFSGGDAKGYPLEVGSGSFIPGFEDQLMGAKNGETRQVKVTFPNDYFVEALAGKEAEFNVTIHDIKRKQLPELNDDFAKDAGEFNTLEELKADLRNKLEVTAKDKAEKSFKSLAIKAAVDNANVDIPEVMIEERIDNMIADFDMSLQSRGMQLEQYLKYINQDIEQLRTNYKDVAYDNVKSDLVLETIAKKENIEVSEKDLDIEIIRMAAEYKTTAEEVRKIIVEQGRVEALAAAVIRRKAANIVLDSVVKE